MVHRYGADGGGAGPGRAPDLPSPAQHEPARPGAGTEHIDHDAWTGGAEEPPPISGAMVQQHRTLPHGELRAGFGAHLETHYPRLVAQLYAITLNPQEAHDAVQDAYSRAWRRWSALSDRGAAGYGEHEDPAVGWIRRVAIRTSMRGRFLRLRRRRRPAAEETDPRTGALLEALGRLAPADRRAVVLHHMAGLSVAAVAELEAADEWEIGRRLARGREVVTEGMAEVLEEIVGAPAPYVARPAYGGHRGYGPHAAEGGRG
ncbi:hypothetical protein [Pseudonocardia sp. NPDC049635]|uniref:RNA polymerase sigma factor n=1 Tax=Pseudonocardia sp. NPDC049635 TaxID=3155506 RepID=UPI0033DCBA7D